jgi:hypothetical protein
LKAGEAREAEAVHPEDLKRHPGNGWALYGLDTPATPMAAHFSYSFIISHNLGHWIVSRF